MMLMNVMFGSKNEILILELLFLSYPFTSLIKIFTQTTLKTEGRRTARDKAKYLPS